MGGKRKKYPVLVGQRYICLIGGCELIAQVINTIKKQATVKVIRSFNERNRIGEIYTWKDSGYDNGCWRLLAGQGSEY